MLLSVKKQEVLKMIFLSSLKLSVKQIYFIYLIVTKFVKNFF